MRRYPVAANIATYGFLLKQKGKRGFWARFCRERENEYGLRKLAEYDNKGQLLKPEIKTVA